MDKKIICDYENLYKAYRKAKAGKKFNGSIAYVTTCYTHSYLMNLSERIMRDRQEKVHILEWIA